MSNLGGNSPSEDTDRSNNLQGEKGDKGDKGDVGAASTVPGPPGPTGVVESVVAGTNVTVDATDPANPIVNASGGGSTPTTTLGDLIKRGASADERLPVGSALQVLRVNAGGTDLEYADPAAAGNEGTHALTETVIGTWLGETLYRKVIDFGAAPNNTTKAVAHGIVGMKNCVSAHGFAVNSADNHLMIPYSSSSASGSLGIFVDLTNLSIFTGTNRSSYDIHMTLEYTKV